MKKSLLLVSFLIASLAAFAQGLVAPSIDYDDSKITKSSFFIRLVDTNLSETRIELVISGGGQTINKNLSAGSVFSLPIEGLIPKTMYSVRARAVGAGGTFSPWSNITYITTKVDVPASAVLTAGLDCPYNASFGWEIPQRAEDVTTIVVQKSFDNGGWNTVAELYPGTRSYFDYDATPGRRIFYRLLLRNETGTTPSQSVAVDVQGYRAGLPPQNVISDKIDKSTTHLTLKWTNPDQDFRCKTDIRESYHIMYKLATETDYKLLTDVSPYTTSVKIPNLKPKDIVDYRIFSRTERGIQSAWVGGRDTTIGPPYAPSNVTVLAFNDALNNSSFTINWKDNSNDEDYFVVEYSTDSVNFVKMSKVIFNTTSVKHQIEEGTKYYYRVKGGNYSGEGFYSPITFGTVYAYSKAPNAPYGLSAKASGAAIELKWRDDSSREEFYVLERAVDTPTTFVALPNLAKNATTFKDINVVAGKTYYYKIKATNPKGASAYSEIAEAKAGSATGVVSSDGFEIFPNPTFESITMRIPEGIVGKGGEIKIMDSNFKTIEILKIPSFKNEISINFNKFNQGLYNVSISSGDFKDYKKLYKY